jgi:hypothetical protein
MNLIERILNLPAELRSLTLFSIWPTTLRIHYCVPFQGPGSCIAQPVRLTSMNTSSIMFQYYLFRLSDHMITRSWYEAMTEHLNTSTLWDLGDIEQLETYFRQITKDKQQPALHEAFLQRLRSVRHTSISFRPTRLVYEPFDTKMLKILKLLLQLPEFANGQLPLSTVRLHLDDLFERTSNTLDVWAVPITKFARAVHDTKRAVRRPFDVKIACSEEAFHSRKSQRFADVLRHHCGPDTVKWVPTVTCRYAGRLGDLTVIWKRK